MIKILFSVLTLSLLSTSMSFAKPEEYAIFDGRFYNGRYYPRVDIIEWGDAPNTHMEFHVFSKAKPVELRFGFENKDGQNVILVNYIFSDRTETLCRRVVAPGHFKEGFKVYQDKSDKDFDNLLISMTELPETKGVTKVANPKSYAKCVEPEEDKKNSVSESSGSPAVNADAERKTSSTSSTGGSNPGTKPKVDNSFSNW